MNKRSEHFAVAIFIIFISLNLLIIVHGSFCENPNNRLNSYCNQNLEDIKNYEPSSEEKLWLNPRLPKHTRPVYYNLMIYLDENSNSFDGYVNITVEVSQDTNYFIVHAKELYIKNVFIYEVDKKSYLTIQDTFKNKQYDYYVVKTKHKTVAGKYMLQFVFHGNYGKDIGIYKTPYSNTNQEKKYIVSTFFAPNYARRAFPCFDEPSFKSIFKVNVMHHNGYFALSNNLVESIETLSSDLKLTSFTETPPMSVYLLCIIVCNFKYEETISKNGIRIRAYAAENNIEKIKLALKWTSELLTYFETLLDIPFPLKKLDIVSLPEFFAVGMENWGLITFDELELLSDNSSTLFEKLKMATLVSHELAHMWFGDLVTMQWWNETWLNEGFATHFAWKGAKHVLPNCFEANDGGLNVLLSIMEDDDDIYTRPVIKNILEVDFDDVYDNIVYSKGASLLKMVENYIGQEKFIKGISNYLKKHAYDFVTTADLFNELTSTTELNISTIMYSWMKLENFPYLTIERKGKHRDICLIEQHRFFVDSSNLKSVWSIPLSFRTDESNIPTYILFESSMKVNISCPSSEWLKFNADFSGYYAVNYNEIDWNIFVNTLENNYTKINPTDRVNLLFDAFNLASSGKMSYEIPLKMTRFLKKENYHETWALANKFFSTLKNYEYNDQHTTHLIRKYIRRISKYLYDILGWKTNGNYQEIELRKQIIQAACENKNRHCLKTAESYYKKLMENNTVNVENAQLIFNYGLQSLNDEKSFNFMWTCYLKEENPLMKIKYEKSLSYIRNKTLIERLLHYATSDNYFPTSRKSKIIQRIADNDKGFHIVSRYIHNNWIILIDNIGIDDAENVAAKVFSQYQTNRDLQKVKDFYEKHPSLNSNTKQRNKTMDEIHGNIEWLDNNQYFVADWFKKNLKIP